RGNGFDRCPSVEFSVFSVTLEPLHQLDIPEPAKVVVEAARIVVGIAIERAIRLWRICAQNVVATHGKGGVVQQRLPARHARCRLFNYFLILAALYLFGTGLLGVACHRLRFHWLSEDQVVRQLAVHKPDGGDPVLNWLANIGVSPSPRNFGSPLLSKPIVVTSSNAEVKVLPIPG